MIYPWQEGLWRKVQEARDRLPHALLLAGPRGVGKEAFARCLLKGLLCPNAREGFPCGACPSCRQVEAGSHPDALVLSPEGPGRPITIDQVRGLKAFAGLGSEGLRCALIHPAEAMHLPAANSLLKTLEEPPPGTLLLLVSHRPGRLLPTVRSRCQRLPFFLPPREVALAWLSGRMADAAYWLELAGGAPLRALALAEEGEDRRAFLRDLLRLRRGTLDPVACAERWQGRDVDGWILAALADIIRLRHGLPAPREAVSLGEGLGLSELHALWDRIMEVRRQKEACPNLHPRMVAEALLITWSRDGDTPPRHAVGGHQEQGGPL